MTTMTKVLPQPSRNPGAAGGTVPKGSKKSGYARDVRPDLVNAEEAAGQVVPIASETGRQSGRIAPAQRKTPNYRAVSPAEADALLVKRLRGEEPRIAGGLDEPEGVKPEPSQYEDRRMETRDVPEVAAEPPHAPMPPAPRPPDNPQIDLATALAWLTKSADKGRAPAAPPPPPPAPARYRVQMIIEGAGTYSMPAIDVVPAGFGVLVLLPCGSGDATFVPNPGASVRIVFREKVYDCYFPGVAGELPGKDAMVLAMINKQEEVPQ